VGSTAGFRDGSNSWHVRCWKALTSSIRWDMHHTVHQVLLYLLKRGEWHDLKLALECNSELGGGGIAFPAKHARCARLPTS
jgi:hypothetical protein